MTASTKPVTPLRVDEEARSLMAHPGFREALAEARHTPPEELTTLDELDAELQPSAADRADAEAWLDELERRVGAAAHARRRIPKTRAVPSAARP